jgi:hypothetical protein
MPMLIMLTSTNTGFTFEIANVAGTGAVLTPSAASYPFDYITMPVN